MPGRYYALSSKNSLVGDKPSKLLIKYWSGTDAKMYSCRSIFYALLYVGATLRVALACTWLLRLARR